MNAIHLSEKQQLFVHEALKGHNILVNACIGSGKTTAIQLLCSELPKNKNILYLTYNRLLNLNYSRRYGTEPARCHVWVGGYKTGNAQSFPHRKGYTTPLGVLGLF